MDEYWENKIEEVIKVAKEYGYPELNKEFWMNTPAILTSIVLDMHKTKEKIVKDIDKELKAKLKEYADEIYHNTNRD